MANWSPLRTALAFVDDRVTYSWDELDALVGGLPRSAYEYPAFWKGDRSGWPSFTTVDVQVGDSVTFVRRTPRDTKRRTTTRPTPTPRPRHALSTADMTLVGCVKQKLDRPAPARDLYTSPLFRKARSYAEASGAPWFILSAEHGLVTPTAVVAPYDLQLSQASSGYRRDWGNRVVAQLHREVGPLTRRTIEIHAGAAYVDAIRGGVQAAGATVVEPLHGLPFSARLAWYGKSATNQRTPTHPGLSVSVEQLIERLNDVDHAVTPAELLNTGGVGLKSAGLYTWWVDAEGAEDLRIGLGHHVAPGLIYAGLAGAARSRSGRRSTNTLWGRIRGMHLGSNHEFSTFRLSLGSILAHARHEPAINEGDLTSWMHRHLRVATIPVDDADTLDELESAILGELNPPLNLAKVARTTLRARLTELRRQFGQ